MAKTQKGFVGAAIGAALLVGLIAGCTKDDSTTGPASSSIQAPKNLRAYAAGPTSVGLQWDLSTSESDASFTGYVINTKKADGSAAIAATNIQKGVGEATIAGLTEGVIYTFVIRSTGTGGLLSADSSSVRWSPAKRLTTDESISEIKVYEFASSVGSSGLQFYSVTTGTAKTQSLTPSNTDRVLADVYLSTDGGGAISLKNMTLLPGPTIWKNTFFSDSTHNAENLNFARLAPPDTNSYTQNFFTIPAGTTSLSKIIYAKSITDNKYVRILIKRNSSNSLISGASPDRFITVEISYQNTAGNPYARPSYSIQRMHN
jgi:hypothetical protein